jgi:peptide/nickel transport system ATP-binding protein
MTEIDRVPILALEDAVKTYALRRKGVFGPRATLRAVDGVTLDVMPRSSVAIVGESGSGKTTLTRMLIGDTQPDEGYLRHRGEEVWAHHREQLPRLRHTVQMVMQNPRSSLDPRMTVLQSLLQPLRALDIAGNHFDRIREIIDQVGLASAALQKYPHEFSGGQLQRVAIARALAPRPAVLVADEPVSALDVSIQAQVLNLLKDLMSELDLSLVMISHDLAVVAYTTEIVHVMAGGRVVETGAPTEIFRNPRSEETKALVDAVITVEDGLAGRAL